MSERDVDPRGEGLSWSSVRLLPPVIWVPLIAVLLASLAVTALSEWSARRARASGTQVAEVLHRLEALADLRVLLTDVETGERGYLLTRDPVYLRPFAAAVRRLPEAQRQIAGLMPANPQIDARLARLNDLIARFVAETTAIVDEFNSGRRDEALARFHGGTERELMESFRREVAELERLSRAQLRELGAAQAESAFWSRVGLVLMTLVSLGLLFVVARFFVAEAVRQERRRSAAEHEAKELEKLVEARTRELSALSTHLQQFAEKERSDLARDLHDELGGLLTAAKMDLSWLQGRVAEPALQQRLAQLGHALDEAMNVKRRVVEDLRPSLLDHFGLPAALRAHLEAVCGKAGLRCELVIGGDADPPVPKDIAIALFRVVQEGLTNVIRHAGARSVRLELSSGDGRYVLRLSDDGCGFDAGDPAFRWSHGLTGMRHRVKALGGRFAIDSAPGRGTTLTVELPGTGDLGQEAAGGLAAT